MKKSQVYKMWNNINNIKFAKIYVYVKLRKNICADLRDIFLMWKISKKKVSAERERQKNI